MPKLFRDSWLFVMHFMNQTIMQSKSNEMNAEMVCQLFGGILIRPKSFMAGDLLIMDKIEALLMFTVENYKKIFDDA